MANQKIEKQANENGEKNDREVEVLYQRLGDRWFAFSLVDDEVFFGSVPAEALDGQGNPKGPDHGRNL
jgi:hypothetical protein